MKAVVDRVVEYPNRYRLINAETGAILGVFDFVEETGLITQVGTEINAELFNSIKEDIEAERKSTSNALFKKVSKTGDSMSGELEITGNLVLIDSSGKGILLYGGSQISAIQRHPSGEQLILIRENGIYGDDVYIKGQSFSELVDKVGVLTGSEVNAPARIRIDTAANWENENPILPAGFFGYDTTNNRLKIGTGGEFWNKLNYFVTQSIPSFADDDWATIASYAESGKAASVYKVGDEKQIALSDGEIVTLVILGFNHDDLADNSGKAGITIGMKQCSSTLYKMNASGSTIGNFWRDSTFRFMTVPTLELQLPADLQKVIKKVNKATAEYYAASGNAPIVQTIDTLFLLSVIELSGDVIAKSYCDDDEFLFEGEQYEYWRTVKDGTLSSDRIKTLALNGPALGWWLRSHYPNEANASTAQWIYISRKGEYAMDVASSNYGISFAFCV